MFEYQQIIGHQGFDRRGCSGPGFEPGKQRQLQYHSQKERIGGKENVDPVPVTQSQHQRPKRRCRRRGNKHDQADQPEQPDGFLPANLVPHYGRYRYRTKGTANALHHAPGDHARQIVRQRNLYAVNRTSRMPNDQDCSTTVTKPKGPANRPNKSQDEEIDTERSQHKSKRNGETTGNAREGGEIDSQRQGTTSYENAK